MSQQNVVIDRPLIRPRPVAYLGKNYYLYDNFADLIYTNRVGCAANGFRYQDWTVQTGTWTAAAGYLNKTATDNTLEYISMPSRWTVGTWECDFKMAATDRSMYFVFMCNETTLTVTADGYMITVHRGGANNLDIWEINNNVWTEIVAGAWVSDTNWHTASATRDAAGNFELFLDGASLGTGSDVTTTDSLYVICAMRGTSDLFDNMGVYR